MTTELRELIKRARGAIDSADVTGSLDEDRVRLKKVLRRACAKESRKVVALVSRESDMEAVLGNAGWKDLKAEIEEYVYCCLGFPITNESVQV